MQATTVTPQRLAPLLDAVVAMSSDLTIDSVLQDVVDAACALVGAPYGIVVAAGQASPGRVLAAHGPEPDPLVADRVVRGEAANRSLQAPIGRHDPVATLHLAGADFSAADREVVSRLAEAAGIAVENARLLQRSEHQRRWLAATADLATAMLRPLSRAAAQQLIAERARDVASADLAAVLAPGSDGRTVIAAVTGMTRDVVGRPLAVPWVMEIVTQGHPITTDDVARDPRLSTRLRDVVPGLRALHGQPLPLENGTAVLVLGWLDGHESRAAGLDPSLPRGFAQQAALAMQVVRAREGQSRLAILEDRDRIGRDLHDTVIQRLFAVGLTLDSLARSVDVPAAERLGHAVDNLDATVREIRRTVFDLTLRAAPLLVRVELEQTALEVGRLLGLRPTVRCVGDVDGSVPVEVAEQLVAVLHEATSNVVRHSGATRLDLLVEVGDDIVLQVTDDGRGVAPDALVGNGLRNLRHRAEALGGTCEFEQPDGGGLRVRWVVPRRDA